MAIHQVPRKTKGEGRILMIFSLKAFLYTLISGSIGGIFFFLFKSIGLFKVGLVFLAVFALIGFSIGTFKIPEIRKIPFTSQVAGSNIDDVIMRYIKYKIQKKKIYLFK